ncbi:hypothetical protein E2C01_033928 [Portunus trituberculatus]|uniref:Uncharacterized protein n=1 Tax=Portunus trituberculatus TaxID=210409 RepID=A0A5B7F057_PORTR|nr:hypothetical protein [Portunus trituberculatus]
MMSRSMSAEMLHHKEASFVKNINSLEYCRVCARQDELVTINENDFDILWIKIKDLRHLASKHDIVK